MDYYSFIDSGFEGNKFTWFKGKKKERRIKERLDRYFINFNKLSKCHSLKVNHLSFQSSDHRPITASFSFQNTLLTQLKGKRIARFEEAWTSFGEVRNIIEKIWNIYQCERIGDWVTKADFCIKELLSWIKKRLDGSIRKAIDRKEKEIRNLSLNNNN